MIETKQHILDAAERLFGENGYGATSLRQIIKAAGVNLAAVHYHFGSKEELLDQIILRDAAALNQRRAAMLDQVEAEAGTSPPSVEKLLEAFFLPMCETARQRPAFVKMMSRMQAEGLVQGLMLKHFEPVIVRFLKALQRALPDVPEVEVLWRVHFMIGAMTHAMGRTPEFSKSMGVVLRVGDYREMFQRLIVFLGAGFQAGMPQGK
ncbi:MAG TPA: TetR/AcrR family transcriptional regulator [Bryobacteraceae bacterium]|nr:TetR/AcrR family transcriptional regulator [Bryobacteraceae bacterium]